MSSIQTGRSTPVERGSSGSAVSSERTTPSRLARPASRLNRFGGGAEKRTGDSTKEAASDEGEGEKRTRTHSEVRRVSVTTTPVTTPPPRSGSRMGGKGLPSPSSFASGRGLQKSAIHGSDSRLVSPGSVPSGDISAGLRKISLPLEKERSFSSSEPGTAVGDMTVAKKPGSGLQGPTQRVRGQSSSSIAITGRKAESGVEERVSVKCEGVEREESEVPTSSKLAKPSSLPRLGAASPGDRRKSPSGLSKLPQPLSTSQGFLPTAGPRGSKVVARGDERGTKFGVATTRERVGSNNSILEGSTEEERSVKLEKQVSSTSSTGSSTTVSESPKPVEPDSKLVAPVTVGKDNRRISPEGMSPDRKTLSNESLGNENLKNGLNKQVEPAKLIEDAAEGERATRNGTGTEKVGEADDTETQTPNLSQGSEVVTDTTLSSLSLASVSSPPPSQPETGQAPYSNSASPLTKRSTSPSQSSHDSHVTSENKGAESGGQSSPRHFNPLRSPLAKEKEKAKRAQSLSPKFSRRVFPAQPQVVGPSVSVSQYDPTVTFSPPHTSTEHRLAHLDLTRVDSPESVKSDIVAPAYSSSRKPLRSSLRAMRDKDSSSSSVDSAKVHLLANKVTISPRSSQVVFLPDEAGLQHSAAFSQPTILSPAKRTRGRPSSVSDSASVDKDKAKRESVASERMDYSTVEQFLSPSLGQNVSHQRYDSTPEVGIGGRRDVYTR